MGGLRLCATAKWIWIFLVIFFVTIYAFEKADLIQEGFKRLEFKLQLEAMMLIVVGKIGLIVIMVMALRQYSIYLDLHDAYCIYNLTQLAKYIPGSIWQFVSRIAMLKARQKKVVSIRDALLAEHVWVIGSALLLAGLLACLRHAELIEIWFGWVQPNWYWTVFACVLILFLIGIIKLFSDRRMCFSRWLYALRPPLLVFSVLIFIWFALGTAFWVTLEPFVEVMPSISYVVATYCFAYVVGFLVPFAPAGIGIREALLILALAPYVGSEFSVFLAGFNRAIYFFAELVLASACVFTFNQSSGEKSS